MAEADYLLAALPDRHIILGQLLRPFALGHMMILKRMGNGFVCPGSIPTIDDLIAGVFICSQPVEEALEALQDPKLPSVLKEWGEKLGEFSFAEKFQAFHAYITAASTGPELYEPESAGRTPGAPFLQTLKVALQSELNCSPSEALNYPLGAAVHDFCALKEMRGGLKIVSEDDLETLAEHERILKEMGAEIEKLQKEVAGE